MTAPAALPDTIVKTVHDTTVVRDTIFHYLGRVPQPFDVKVDDPLSWVPTIVAAFLGAGVGGLLSMLASMAAIHDEWKLDREEDLSRLLKRVTSNLRRFLMVCEAVCGNGSEEFLSRTAPFSVAVGDGFEALWNTYYRVSEPIFSLGDDDLSEEVDDFFLSVRKVGVVIRDWEKRDRTASNFWTERRHEIHSLSGRVAGLLRKLERIDPAALARRSKARP